MYRDIDAVTVLVENLDHLLIAITLGHAYQTAELSHTMIDMHHEITHLELLDLF